MINDVFSGNRASYGGGVYDGAESFPSIINCTLSANSALYGGGAYDDNSSAVTIHNSILWGNIASLSGANYFSNGGNPTIASSDIPGVLSGILNISADPQFVRNPSAGPDGKWGTADDDYSDLHLPFTSPCIDAGSNAAVPASLTTDFDGNPRIVDFPGVNNGAGAVVDMGAYELGFNLDEIIVPGGQSLALPAGGYAFTANSVSIGPGGSLDISDDSLTINYGTNSDPIATISSLLASGQDNGVGIISSSTFGVPANVIAIGYFDDTINGQLTIRRTWIGDANLDGVINADDLSLMLLGQYQGSTLWQGGNFNYDARIDSDDWSQFFYAAAYSRGQSITAVTPAFSQDQIPSASNLAQLLN